MIFISHEEKSNLKDTLVYILDPQGNKTRKQEYSKNESVSIQARENHKRKQEQINNLINTEWVSEEEIQIKKQELYPEYKQIISLKREYDKIEDFKDGFALVGLGRKWGFINTKGEEVGEIKYDKIEDFKDGFAKVKSKDKWGLINTKGEEIVESK